MKRILSLCMILILGCFLLTGCSGKVKAADLMEGITKQEGVQTAVHSKEYAPVLADFAIRLFKNCYSNGDNQLISPLSVIMALGMTANGAAGETLSQFEKTFGVPIDALNQYLSNYMEKVMAGGEKSILKLANSIWFADRFNNISQVFLQKNANFYGAEIYKRVFDSSAAEEINNWIDKNTDGMIKKMLDGFEDDDLMVLINALCFDAEWIEPYEEQNVKEGIFTKEDGTVQNVDFMGSAENIYIEDSQAKGFVKKYKGLKYAFVALLPNEGISVADYVSSLEGDKLLKLISSAQNCKVYTKTPKFSFDYSVSMAEIIKKLGIVDAFDSEKADFSDMVAENEERKIFISKILHKTYIRVDEKGTKAGAATMVIMNDATALPTTKEPPKVYLDRPFVFMLIDTESNVPFFIGTVMDVE